MNSLRTDSAYHFLNKHGEQLCGDHVEIVEQDDSFVMVLADGLGSGVKASILSTLTSKIISTMIINQMSIEECVSTIASTLPVCEKRGIAYSTFTIIRIDPNKEAEIILYDNPPVIILRDGKNYEYETHCMQIGDKTIYRAHIALRLHDLLIATSDGAVYAGVGRTLNYGWQRENIISYLEDIYNDGYSARMFSDLLISECSRLYGGMPGDDTTVSVIQIRNSVPVNLMIGPPCDPGNVQSMMDLFFKREGKHIICGGTTSKLAARHLDRELVTSINYLDAGIPPTAKIEGVDLVTEGIITMNKVLEKAHRYLADSKYDSWNYQRDGASLISCTLFEEATDIHFFVGTAINPAHQNPNLPGNLNLKMRVIDELAQCLKKMGKRIQITYF